MGVWSPAFEHKFLDGNLLNFTAAPQGADPDIAFEAPLVRPTPPLEARGFPVRSGNRFRYAFEPGLFGNIIGADIRADIVFPPGTTGQTLGNVVLGSDAIRFLLGFVNGAARIQLVVNGAFHAAVANFDPAAPLRLQGRWHTHGQAQIWVNGDLVSYTPRLASGQSLSIEKLEFGHHSTSPSPAGTPAFLIRRLGVKLLRKDDAQRALNRLFPIDAVQVDPACRRRFAAAQDGVFREIRGFMEQAIGKLTHPWSAGQPGGPFTPEGLAAHAAAVAAGQAFVEFMLQRPGRGDPAVIEAKLGEFLAAVRATDPAAYDQAIARLAATSTPLDADCLAQLQPLIDRYGAQMARVQALLQALWARMQAPQVAP